jgi:dihydrofolate reductase
MTLDGFFEGENHSIEWHNVDEEFNKFAVSQLETADILVFGRVTYELMSNYWPTPLALNDDPIVAQKMNSLAKIVISKSQKRFDWDNTIVIRDNIKEQLLQLKQQPGKNIFIFGSALLTSSILDMNLIDEYRIMINPVVLGRGKSLFLNIMKKINLRLIDTKVFKSGNVLLYYEPEKLVNQ